MKSVEPPADRLDPRRLLATLLGRCPACSRGDVFESFYRTRSHCPVCRAAFERNAGNWTGPVVIAYTTASVAAFVAGTVLVARFGFAAWVAWALMAVASAAALLALRPAKAFWIWLLWATGLVFADPTATPAAPTPEAQPRGRESSGGSGRGSRSASAGRDGSGRVRPRWYQ